MIKLNVASIQSKLILIVLFTASCSLLLSGIGIYRYLSTLVLDSEKRNQTILAHIISDRSVAALSFNDKMVAEKNLQSLSFDNIIKNACLYDADSRFFAGYTKQGDQYRCDETLDRHKQTTTNEATILKGVSASLNGASSDAKLVTYMPVEFNQRVIGYLTMQASIENIRQLNNNAIKNTLIYSLIAFMFAVFLILLLKNSIVMPLRELTLIAGRVSRTKNYSLRANKHSSDETGYLTDQFNTMLETIEGQEKHLYKQTQELEGLVHKLEYQATHDSLTNLYNRFALETYVDDYISGMPSDQHGLLCYIDLDHFKILNDTCGHVIGDELLKRIALLMKDVFSKKCIVSRMGGDEFVVLMMNYAFTQGKSLIDEFLLRIEQMTFFWSGRTFPISASVGITTISHSSDFKQLLIEADSACYKAKRSGPGHFQLFSYEESDIDQRHSDIVMINYLKQSLKEDNFLLYSQPIFGANFAREVYSHEILLRLRAGDNSILSADEFIPLAEEYNLMLDIDYWVVNKTFEYIELHDSSDRYFINLSGPSLANKDFANDILGLADKYHINPQSICFEITETLGIGDINNCIDIITMLRAHGFEFALDDFGSGYSTMDYLRVLPVDYIKLDSSLVANIYNDPVSLAFVESVITLCHLVNKKTIAEHIHDSQTHHLAVSAGVDYFQGFWLQEPLEL